MLAEGGRPSQGRIQGYQHRLSVRQSGMDLIRYGRRSLSYKTLFNYQHTVFAVR